MDNEERLATAGREPAHEEAIEETRPRTGQAGKPAAARSRIGSPIRRDLRRSLSSRRALREAILLHEILGPPKGMERSEG